MDQPDLQSQISALLVTAGELQNKADGLIKDIETRPFQMMCRDRGITASEVLSVLESQMNADELDESRSSFRSLKNDCEEQVRRELGLPVPETASAKVNRRRFI
jgi:hypothetical protein